MRSYTTKRAAPALLGLSSHTRALILPTCDNEIIGICKSNNHGHACNSLQNTSYMLRRNIRRATGSRSEAGNLAPNQTTESHSIRTQLRQRPRQSAARYSATFICRTSNKCDSLGIIPKQSLQNVNKMNTSFSNCKKENNFAVFVRP